MPKKRSTQSGSNSVTAKLISKINKFGQNTINNSSFDQAYDQNPRNFDYDDDDDEVFVLTAKQKQQIQRNEYLESLTKEQLKSEAKRRGQKTAGTKTELVDIFPSLLVCLNWPTNPFFQLLFFPFPFRLLQFRLFSCNSGKSDSPLILDR